MGIDLNDDSSGARDVVVQKLPMRRSNKTGRPPTYRTPLELQKAVDAYFDDVDEKTMAAYQAGLMPVPPTTARLTLALGFSNTASLTNYAQKTESFSSVIQQARLRIRAWHEVRASNYGNNSLGWLKKNVPEEWGDPDKEQEDGVNGMAVTGNVTINIQKNYGITKKDDDQ